MGFIIKTDLVTDRLAYCLAEFFGDTVSHSPRSNPPRLGMTDKTRSPKADRQANLRQLRGLARAGFAADDHHLIVLYQLGDVVFFTGDRQIRKIQRRNTGQTFVSGRDRSLNTARQRVKRLKRVFALLHLATQSIYLALKPRPVLVKAQR